MAGSKKEAKQVVASTAHMQHQQQPGAMRTVLEDFPYANSALINGLLCKKDMPEEPMAPHVVESFISDQLDMDFNPKMNLASFVCPYMDPEAEVLMSKALKRNLIDTDANSHTLRLHNHCVTMISSLFHAPQEGVGSSTVGSSEAIFLAALAMKMKWKKATLDKDPNTDISKPNLILSSAAHECWFKACAFLDISPNETRSLHMTASSASKHIDNNTIGIVAVLGNDYNSEIDDIESLNALSEKTFKSRGVPIPIHVDAAVGGFILPFTQPDLKWDFRLSEVKSINVSGHKFGYVYAAVGWLLFREKSDIPMDLKTFNLPGALMQNGESSPGIFSLTLNSSRGSAQVIGQLYTLMRYGKLGFKALAETCEANAKYLRFQINQMDVFDIRDKAKLPMVVLSLKDESKFTVFDVQESLREKGWIVAALTWPSVGNTGKTHVLKITCKMNFTRDQIDIFLKDIKECLSLLLLDEKAKKKIIHSNVAISDAIAEGTPEGKKRKLDQVKNDLEKDLSPDAKRAATNKVLKHTRAMTVC